MTEFTLHRLLNKLKRRSLFTPDDEAALLALPFSVKSFKPGGYLVRQGDRRDFASVLFNGFAYRQKVVGNGGRQIVALHVEGDAVDLQNSLLKTADHSVQALGAVDVGRIPCEALLAIAAARPVIAQALWLDTLADGAIALEWITNIGRRNALSRLAHLLCEIALRLEAIDLYEDGSRLLPMTQVQMGDSLGLTAVHVNRMFGQLEEVRLIARKNRAVIILDLQGLRSIADFQTAYLHLDLLDN
ncbi:Crp/Fnr family transcriptional regulator [Sphingomonas sp. RB3P16]|uniref:Crp/Fnr family transcriptional regulator n=1 Tax=Parasphingomonas frigoris TaxID=3096163 RepID=UPI002FCB1CC4